MGRRWGFLIGFLVAVGLLLHLQETAVHVENTDDGVPDRAVLKADSHHAGRRVGEDDGILIAPLLNVGGVRVIAQLREEGVRE